MGCAVLRYCGAMRCAVPRQHMVLCGVQYCSSIWCYAMCGTEAVYGATRADDSTLDAGRPGEEY
eukprot:3314838-Rhodomonas_salina.1